MQAITTRHSQTNGVRILFVFARLGHDSLGSQVNIEEATRCEHPCQEKRVGLAEGRN